MIEVPQHYNLVDHFVDRHLREDRGGKTALICEGAELTYAQLARQVNRVGNGLLQLGIQEEQRVLLLLPDGPEFAAAYFGVMKIGAVAVPASTALRASDYAFFLDESRARALIVHASLYEQVEPALAARRFLRHVIVCGDPRGHIDWNEWLAAQPPSLDPAPTNRDDVAFWLWTSGTTGMPKAAVHLHHDWIYCCENYASGILGIAAGDVTFSSSKLFHAYGLGNGLMFPCHAGAATVLYPGRPQAKVILQKAQDTRPTLFFSVPTLYAAMLQEAENSGPYDLTSIRLAVSAAEPLPPEIFRKWKERFGIEILDGIGSTEVLHIYLSPRPGQAKPGSTGQPVPGYRLRIVDLNGLPVPAGEIGDLLVGGESTAQSYWNHQQLSSQRMQGEWFHSGDKYSVDDDGYYWYAGRSDDMFRVSGQWVSPVEVESVLVEHHAVLEAAVVPYQEDNGLHTTKAFVVLKHGAVESAALIAELQNFVKQRITPYKYPRRIQFLDHLPRSAAGKVLRYKLRELRPESRKAAMD